MKTIPLAGFVVLLTGCAAYQLPPPGANHPAAAEAASAPERLASNTLAYTRSDIPSPQPMVAAAAQGGQEGHGGHAGETGAQKMVGGTGKVVATVPSSSQLVVEHGEIKGFMDAMTMGYRVEPATLLDGLKPGDQVHFSIDVSKKTIVKIEKQ